MTSLKHFGRHLMINANQFSTQCNTKKTPRKITRPRKSPQTERCCILIVGGGTGGCALAAKLSSKLGPGKVIVLDSADRHYYQPMLTLIGAGSKRLEHCFRPMVNVLPKKAKWIKDKAVEFDPDRCCVTTFCGTQIKYEILLLAMGLQLNYDKIPGLVDALSIPKGKVCSIYSPLYVDRTFYNLKRIKCGNALFTYPRSPIKCAGAPQKILYLAEHYFRKNNRRKNINLCYHTPLPVIFGVKHYAKSLMKIVKNRNIGVNFGSNLIKVNPDKNTAVFQNLDEPSNYTIKEFAMLHAVPPMGTPTELNRCKKLVDKAGFVDVNQHTLQHRRYKNIFAIGDCSSCPNSKTAAAAAAQSPVVFLNILAVLEGKELKAKYNGYASCPLLTSYCTCILAEFDYSLTPLETFPFDQNKERYSMFFLKKYIMPFIYWNVMMKGNWNGPAPMRRLMSFFKFGKKK